MDRMSRIMRRSSIVRRSGTKAGRHAARSPATAAPGTGRREFQLSSRTTHRRLLGDEPPALRDLETALIANDTGTRHKGAATSRSDGCDFKM